MSESSGRPELRVVRGEPTDAEVVALVTALSVVSKSVSGSAVSGASGGAPARSRWADRASRLRTALPHGPGAWRASARLT